MPAWMNLSVKDESFVEWWVSLLPDAVRMGVLAHHVRVGQPHWRDLVNWVHADDSIPWEAQRLAIRELARQRGCACAICGWEASGAFVVCERVPTPADYRCDHCALVAHVGHSSAAVPS